MPDLPTAILHHILTCAVRQESVIHSIRVGYVVHSALPPAGRLLLLRGPLSLATINHGFMIDLELDVLQTYL